MDIAKVRAEFPACERTVYLNTGFLGPSPRAVVKAVQDRIAYENEEGPTTRHVLESGRALTDRAKLLLAQTVRATPEELHLTQNTTEGLNIVLNGFDWRPGDEMITVNIEYPAVMILAYHVRERYGVNVRVVDITPTEPPASIVRKITDAMTPRTRMVFLSHVHYLNGMRMPVAELRRVTRQRGVRMLLDGAQCLGHIDLDMRGMDVDYYAMPGQKWLCGPDGIGALYIKKELIQEIKPHFVAFGVAKRWDAVGGYEENVETMNKFQLTTSSAPLRAGLVAALEFFAGMGVKAIEQRNVDLAGVAKQALSAIPGVTVHSPGESPEATGIVTFSVEGKNAKDVVDGLWEQRRVVTRSVEPLNGVRFSFHFFNTEEEVAMATDTVRKLAT
ncbi:MAG: aminotransferase class V-fold PLP-dependent enzyme [Dehalococcoidia bacterium]|nr:aminotransferase class V-fold PLP-dependent enzyme [Dehalococcoidia bacterium]